MSTEALSETATHSPEAQEWIAETLLADTAVDSMALATGER